RDYIHVSDVSDALVKAMLYSGNKRVFNIGSGTGTSLNKLLATIEDATHKEVKRVYLSGRSVDVPVNVLDNTLAKKELHWNLKIPLEEGIKRTIDIYLKQKMQ
ncbi:MAG: NAD-dependent epimerase, partial [Candidatus Scalindua sp.]|nr:NAD-dependent epimerase [Candidatus Scalindua sp.]